MIAVTIPNPLPAELVALSAQAAADIRDLAVEAERITTVATAEDHQRTDRLLVAVVRAIREIEAERKALKSPVVDLGRALDEAAGEAIAPLLAIKARLGNALLTYQNAENARRQEEFRRQREIAEQAAREAAERARLRAEGELSAQDEPPPDIEPVVFVPEIMPPAPGKEMKSSAVKFTTLKKVVIFDQGLVPDEINGQALWKLDEVLIGKLAKAGLQIPGVRVDEVTNVAAK